MTREPSAREALEALNRTGESLFDVHRPIWEQALEALTERSYWSPYPESAGRKHHPNGARERGAKAFEERLGRKFMFDTPLAGATGAVVGEEVSPYTGEPLGVRYPKVDPAAAMDAAAAAMPTWGRVSPIARVGVCLDILARLAESEALFEATYATMQTTGMPFRMAFTGNGANALDRGLEAVAMALRTMAEVPESARFARAFGPGEPTKLEKRYRIRPLGVAVVVSCGSFPAWNAYPALFANLATGNPVVLKPHPRTVLPMALAVALGREALEDAGFDPNLLTLAADTEAEPNTLELAHHPACRLLDFTGGQGFGRRLETELPGRGVQVYTETSGCNSVVVESVADDEAFEQLLMALAHGLSLFSAQMCTAAQNVFVPRDGIDVASTGQRVPLEAFRRRLVDKVDALLADPAHAAAICGALHAPAVAETVTRVAEAVDASPTARVLRPSAPYAHPAHPSARTATPLIAEVDVEADHALYAREHFGPVSFLIPCDGREHALARATSDAKAFGAISSYAYSADPDFQDAIEDAFADAGASVGLNLLHQLPINYSAAFSDFHVTGLNPAGNATLTDLAFVASRFRIVQSKRELPARRRRD